jgi:thiamine-phosphate pyrophosphorylase
MDRRLRGYYFITDSGLSLRGNISDVKNALAAGVGVIQYREKLASTKEMYEEALRLRKICQEALFLINDRLDIALVVNADGVHLGQQDLPYYLARRLLGSKRIIGITVHNIKEARQAEEWGADYISVSPIFPTRTKKDAGQPTGVELIKEIRKRVSLPIIAIGGISLARAPAVIQARAQGLCAISACITKPDVKAEIEKFQKLFLEKNLKI